MAKKQTVSGGRVGSPAQYIVDDEGGAPAAIVTGINNDGTVNLVVFTEGKGVEFISNVEPDKFALL